MHLSKCCPCLLILYLLFYAIAHTLIVAVCIIFQMSSSIKEYWEKREAEVGAVVVGNRTRKPSRKRQDDNSDHSSSQEKVKANPKAKAQEQKRKNDKSYTKKSTKKQATANQVANSESKIK